MNLSRPLLAPARLLHRVALKSRRLLPRQRSRTFGASTESERHRIERIYAINLDRHPDRWAELTLELNRVLDSSGAPLARRVVRWSGIDAGSHVQAPPSEGEIDPLYTLGDQLAVEPQPLALPERLELDRPIQMSPPEVAVARSHIGVWRQVAAGEEAYALVLEDDVWFRRGFGRYLDRAWAEMDGGDGGAERFDMLYLSYKEVKDGAQKTFLSSSVFRPVRGLWYLSGYVLSRRGATKLLELLPCRGPVDLWINHQFGSLDVRATRRSLISQRRDSGSSNSYSILPVLTKIGVLDSEGESLFRMRPQERPVFAFGPEGSGLSALAMALSMLGYRCCSDLEDLPTSERESLLAGSVDRVFDAYVNVGSLRANARTLGERYPRAKFLITTSEDSSLTGEALDIVASVGGKSVAVVPAGPRNWKTVCEFLRCPPPVCSFPDIPDVGQRRVLDASTQSGPVTVCKAIRRDRSPWVLEPRRAWRGVHTPAAEDLPTGVITTVRFNGRPGTLDTTRWVLREDTFPGNLGLFRSSNVRFCDGIGAVLTVKKEALGVRDYSAASISSRDRFRFGRFEAELRATNVPGVVTGFFLHRDSPRQEIDVEIVGSRTDRLLVNVFYNPGGEGAPFDYGYRGSPSLIELGFDASESLHRYTIEWFPGRMRWLVDDRLVHERADWDPTPVPHLPMALHVNAWPSRSRKLAGRLADRRLPTTAVLRSIVVEANVAGARTTASLPPPSARR